MINPLRQKPYAARELYRHVYDLKDWHVEDESLHTLIQDLVNTGELEDYLNLFDQPKS